MAQPFLQQAIRRVAPTPGISLKLETTTVAPDWELVWLQEPRNPGTISVDSSIQPYRSTDL